MLYVHIHKKLTTYVRNYVQKTSKNKIIMLKFN